MVAGGVHGACVFFFLIGELVFVSVTDGEEWFVSCELCFEGWR